MADEKTVVKGKEEKANFFTKLINFFKKLPSAIARPFKNMWHELRKVTWPSRQDVVKYSLIVLAFLVFMGVVIGLLDLGSTALVKVMTPAGTVEQAETLPTEDLAGSLTIDETEETTTTVEEAEEAVEAAQETATVEEADSAAD